SGNAMKWKIKRKTNDELRQDFINKTVSQAELIDLKIPDPDLKWNEKRESYDFGEMDWEEFWSVVEGNGPCNEQRLNHHIKAHKEGKWVREAAKAYSQKHNN
ncbi:MAG: 1,2-phenylacetyl-CoA epoxidase subunit A, partial [Flavobacteriales bacterium]|nr:1,2-phenylacetyl-CoA epoxidase subunit A [Flavobacteriales bacterium]